jgi:hypothetical protein
LHNGQAVAGLLSQNLQCGQAHDGCVVFPSGTAPTGHTVYSILDEGAAVLASNRPLIDAILAESTPAHGRSSGQGRGAARRGRHCCGQQPALGTLLA